MSSRRKILVWSIATVLAGTGLAAIIVFSLRKPRMIWLSGAVMVRNADPRKELPIADVEVTVEHNLAIAPAKSDSSGYFVLKLRRGVRRGTPLVLEFRHPNYKPLDLKEFAGDKLYLAHLLPVKEVEVPEKHPAVKVGNVRVRYSIKTVQDVNIGSAVKMFEIENTGNVPCNGQKVCSPNGKWRAGVGAASLDAGPGNEFRDARVSCIAGPCPFTRIESDGFSKGGQTISVSARGWSDTTVFLLEAEVFHKMPSELIHESYPVIYGRTLNFTVPAGAEGVSIESDISGESIIFPLGPALFLTWANCNARINQDQTSVYRCELKPGYRFLE